MTTSNAVPWMHYTSLAVNRAKKFQTKKKGFFLHGGEVTFKKKSKKSKKKGNAIRKAARLAVNQTIVLKRFLKRTQKIETP